MRKKLQKQSFSRLQIFFKIGVLKKIANFTGKYLCWSLFLIKLQASRPATLLRRDSNTGVFLSNFRNFQEHLFNRTSPVATFETKHMLHLPFCYILEQEISTGIKAMMKKLNICFSCRFITYQDRKSRLVQMRTLQKRSERNRFSLLQRGECNGYCSAKIREREGSISPCRFYG